MEAQGRPIRLSRDAKSRISKTEEVKNIINPVKERTARTGKVNNQVTGIIRGANANIEC